jgi:hypothetical protein
MSTMTHSHRRLAREFDEHPYRSGMTIGGVLMLALTLAGVIWMLPEILRYIRIRRM